jgi:hypothetical protein
VKHHSPSLSLSLYIYIYIYICVCVSNPPLTQSKRWYDGFMHWWIHLTSWIRISNHTLCTQFSVKFRSETIVANITWQCMLFDQYTFISCTRTQYLFGWMIIYDISFIFDDYTLVYVLGWLCMIYYLFLELFTICILS